MLLPLQLNGLNLDSGTAVASVSGGPFTEAEIVAGGQTIVITLTNETWIADITAQRQAIIDGLDSAQTETLGWNNEVRDKEVVGAVVRTSDTVVTITLTAATYDITSDETITVTVPGAALIGASPLTASPTVGVTAEEEEEEDAYSGGYAFINAYESYRQRKRKRDKERKEALEAIRDIEDDADREIAQWLQKDIVRDERDVQIAELERLVEKTHQKTQDREAVREMSWRVANAYERAYKQKNFSAIEAFEREMERYIEEEEFLLMAMLL